MRQITRDSENRRKLALSENAVALKNHKVWAWAMNSVMTVLFRAGLFSYVDFQLFWRAGVTAERPQWLLPVWGRGVLKFGLILPKLNKKQTEVLHHIIVCVSHFTLTPLRAGQLPPILEDLAQESSSWHLYEAFLDAAPLLLPKPRPSTPFPHPLGILTPTLF